MENLRIIREKRNLNQLKVATRVGVTQEMISSYETGRSYPSGEILIKLAKYLDTSTDYLLGLTDDETPIRFMDEAKLTSEEIEFINKFSLLAAEDKLRLIGYMDALLKIR